jgi:hypothetical protein
MCLDEQPASALCVGELRAILCAMKKSAIKNFHLPLAPRVYDALQSEATLQKRPASQVVHMLDSSVEIVVV